jgi:hypothetical protein
MNAGKSHCKWCGRGIRYIPHEESRKTAPIDDVPTRDGNILIDEEKGTYRIVTTHTELAKYIGRLHMNHWATCPKAAEHRRAK